ncbi:unnamed protein product [Aphanomyces euteiches]|nr:hypothetical protein AeRB84_017476 [Aphanomyces euteiches]
MTNPKLDPVAVLSWLGAFVSEQKANAHPPPCLPDAAPANFWIPLHDNSTRRVPITEIGAYDAVEKFYSLQSVESVRPVNPDEVREHLCRFGYSPAQRVVLCTPGPQSFKYGIIDGQHRIAALKQLLNDSSLPRGVAFDNLVQDGDDGVLHIPAVIFENANPYEVLQFGYAQSNILYHFKNGQGPFRLIETLSKFVDWNEYKTNMMYSLIETGKVSTTSSSLAQGVHARLQMSTMSNGLPELSLDTIKNYIYVIARAYHFDLLIPLLYEIRDPYQKKEKWTYNAWMGLFENINNYHWFLRRQRHPKWSPVQIKTFLRLLLEGTMFTKKGMWPDKKLDPQGELWRLKYCALRDKASDYIFKVAKKQEIHPEWIIGASNAEENPRPLKKSKKSTESNPDDTTEESPHGSAKASQVEGTGDALQDNTTYEAFQDTIAADATHDNDAAEASQALVLAAHDVAATEGQRSILSIEAAEVIANTAASLEVPTTETSKPAGTSLVATNSLREEDGTRSPVEMTATMENTSVSVDGVVEDMAVGEGSSDIASANALQDISMAENNIPRTEASDHKPMTTDRDPPNSPGAEGSQNVEALESTQNVESTECTGGPKEATRNKSSDELSDDVEVVEVHAPGSEDDSLQAARAAEEVVRVCADIRDKYKGIRDYHENAHWIRCADDEDRKYWTTAKDSVPYVEGIADCRGPINEFANKLQILEEKRKDVEAAHVYMTKESYVRYCTEDSGPNYVSYICLKVPDVPKFMEHVRKVDRESPLESQVDC